MTDLAQPIDTSTIPNAEIERMINTAVDRVSNAVEEKLTAFEKRIEEKFVSYQEFDDLRKRFNAYPSKPAPADELDHIRQELVKVTAAKHTLETQVTDLIGSQRQLRESVVAMRENEVKTNEERTKLQQSLNLTMGILESNRDVMRAIHSEQESARQDRENMRRKLDNQLTENTRIEGRIIDTESRLTAFVTPANDLLFGGHGQPGIQKMFADVKASIEAFEEKYEKNRAADQEALKFSLAMKRWLMAAFDFAKTNTGKALIGAGVGLGIFIYKAILGG